MTALPTLATELVPVPLRDRAAAETYVASVCFKHGPPKLVGVELEWTVHDAVDLRVPLDLERLTTALGPHAPTTISPDSPHQPLPNGALVTVEPGGQVEISAPPHASLAELITAVSADTTTLAGLLGGHGLCLGHDGMDLRSPRRLLDTPRYEAMAAAFEAYGPDGLSWMCATAGLQVCLDAGEPDRVAARWAALHALGPVLSALFANSRRRLGECSTWASARMRAMFRTDPKRNRPAAVTADPAAEWARRAMDAPVICVRRPDGCWEAPDGVTFADWINGAIPGPPTQDDLDYHLSTLFPPVRPRGYLEVRYLDSQNGANWVDPAVLLTALMATEPTVDAVLAATEPAAGRWLAAARYGLTDPRIARAARSVVDLAGRVLAGSTDIGPELAASVMERLSERIARGATVEGVCA